MCEYDEILMKLRINGAKNDEEREWAEKLGMSAYNVVVNWVNDSWFLPVYNWIWKYMFGLKDGEHTDDHPMYLKVYTKLFNSLVTVIAYAKGSHNYQTRRKVVVNGIFTIKPESENLYVVDDMIFVKDF